MGRVHSGWSLNCGRLAARPHSARCCCGALLYLLATAAFPFDSGSTGADLDLNPSVNTEVVLPPNGVLNYRSVNIPAGVTVTFKRNATNTPVIMLVQENATIAGIIDVSGKNSADIGPAGDGNRADDGNPGEGGPGGYRGGFGGLPTADFGGEDGHGPGGGGRGLAQAVSSCGGPAGHATPGRGSSGVGASGKAYGNEMLVPLIGGSGGGGGGASVASRGAGGGGGGGALLLAASGSIVVSGEIRADGASTGARSAEAGQPAGSAGGDGSGGAIRLIASNLVVSGHLSARGAIGCSGASDGRIRLEADTFGQLRATTPSFVASLPQPIFLANAPSLRFVTISGIAVPAQPTGSGDVLLPAGTSNPIAITLSTTGVPVGSVVAVSVRPRTGAGTSVDSPPTVGTMTNATTNVSVDIPAGHSVLSASTTFTVSAAAGEALSQYAHGERVEKIALMATLGRAPVVQLVTVSGRRNEVSADVLRLLRLTE